MFVPSAAVWKPDTPAERVYRIRTIMNDLREPIAQLESDS